MRLSELPIDLTRVRGTDRFILYVLLESTKPLTSDEIEDITSFSARNVRASTKRLRDCGHIQQIPNPAKGGSYLYEPVVEVPA